MKTEEQINVKPEITKPNSAKKRQLSNLTTSSTAAPQKIAKLHVSIDLFEPINCWWEKELNHNTTQWNYLEHHGLMFTPPYEPQNLHIIYRDQKILLPPSAEEVATFWCVALDSSYGEKHRFIQNFWAAFMSKLPEQHILKKTNATFEQVDFSLIKKHLQELHIAAQEQKKNMSKDQRELLKSKKEEQEGPFAYALFDWLREKVGTFKTEPPSLFRGRGEHPKMGVLKRRVFPEDVTLNCDESAPVPRLPPHMVGHCWKDVYHDNTVSWLAFYRDSVNAQFKYTFLGAGSAVKGMKDYLKYEKARGLRTRIDDIRKNYTAKMKSSNIVEKQLGTATYMLDILALRVGNEKDNDEEADTVGCCSLRKEHITFNKKNSTITLDFLGKDSIRYLNTVKVNALAFRNLFLFCQSKKPEDDMFDRISAGVLNRYLRDLMPSLSAKVFRTYNASVTLQNELQKLDPSVVDLTSVDSLKQFYDYANREVAILCNHQRSVPKQHEVSMDKMREQLTRTTDALEELNHYLTWLQNSTPQSPPFSYTPSLQNKNNSGVPYVPVTKLGMKESVVKRKLVQFEKKKELQLQRINMKDANKTVASSTSKQHYMDPRITVSFCKKWELPIEKVFNATLRKKFPWAMYAKSDYVF